MRIAARIVTQLFRNSPWLVLLFLCVFLIPFELRIFGLRIPFPDWAKATLGFALPVMANTSEITRGAILSVATGQWDSARASDCRAGRRSVSSSCRNASSACCRRG